MPPPQRPAHAAQARREPPPLWAQVLLQPSSQRGQPGRGTGYIDFGLLALRWLASYGDLRLVVLAVLALVAGLILVPFAGSGGVVMAIVRTTRSHLAFRRARRTGAAAETYLRGAA